MLEERLDVRVARGRAARVGLDTNLVQAFEFGLIQRLERCVRVRLVQDLDTEQESASLGDLSSPHARATRTWN